MPKIMVFIYESLVRIENALFRFYPVLASIFKSQGFDVGTVFYKMCPKWTSKPCSENVQVLTHVLIDVCTIVASKMD